MSRVPRLSHLQFLVVGVLRRGSAPGREIREVLRGFGIRKSGPAFYQMMARMEDAGLVTGEYHQQVVDGQIIRERHYELTGEGSSAWQGSRDFYRSAIEVFEGGLAGA